MSTFDTMIDRNAVFAEQQVAANTLMPSLGAQLPHVKALIIGCADMRVDPELLLGLEPGQAVVIRNIGGRVTPGLLQQLGLLGRIGETEGAVPGGGGEFHLIVLHHTDCGIKRLANDPALLASYFVVEEQDLPAKSVKDPVAAVQADVAVLRAVPGLPGDWMLSGLVYDVSTGRAAVIVPPKPIASDP